MLRHLILAFLAAVAMTGCKPAATLEDAAKKEAAGQYKEAVLEYQGYLKAHPTGELSARACYRAAKAYEQQGEYEAAIEWYRKVGSGFPGTPEEVDALLDLGSLYVERLKDDAKGLECYEKALQLYLGRSNIRQAIQALTDAQYLTATAYFQQRDFKRADQAANAILRTYPSVFMPTDTRAKVESLVDRVGRAGAIAGADAVMITVREDLDYNKGFDADFPAPFTVDKGTLPSPDRQNLVRLKAGSSGSPSLWLGKAPGPKEKNVVLRSVPGTTGASQPSWSPDGKELVYRRSAGSKRTLEKVDVKTRSTRALFSTTRNTLGERAVYHPAGNKIAFVWEGNVWLINANGTNKSMLKVRRNLGNRAQILFSSDGTMIRYKDRDAKGKDYEGVLVLDIAKFES
jgi:hypothetical protein